MVPFHFPTKEKDFGIPELEAPFCDVAQVGNRFVAVAKGRFELNSGHVELLQDEGPPNLSDEDSKDYALTHWKPEGSQEVEALRRLPCSQKTVPSRCWDGVMGFGKTRLDSLEWGMDEKTCHNNLGRKITRSFGCVCARG